MRLVTLLGAGLLLAGQAQGSTIASSTFAADTEGWTSNTPAEISWQSSGGNPGGYIQFLDATANSTYIYAPGSFLGNYLTLGVTSLSFDADIFAETGVSVVGKYELDLSGPGGAASFFGAQPSTSYPTGWVNVLVPIANTVTPPAGWTLASGTWLGLLANVTQVGIPIELVTNVTIPGDTDREGIDNVALSGSGSVPEPSVILLMSGGLLALGVFRKVTRRENR